MDINYWVIFIILYLLSLYLKKRRQRSAQGKAASLEPEKEKVDIEEELPDFFRKLGFSFPEDEIKEAEEVPAERAEKIPTLEEEIELFERDVEEYKEEAVSVKKEKFPIVEPIVTEKPVMEIEPIKPVVREIELSTPRTKYFVDFFQTTETLKKFIVMREILGLPRGMRPYRSRSYR